MTTRRYFLAVSAAFAVLSAPPLAAQSMTRGGQYNVPLGLAQIK